MFHVQWVTLQNLLGDVVHRLFVRVHVISLPPILVLMPWERGCFAVYKRCAILSMRN